MSIQQHAQNILDLCTAGPIQGGISIEIKREAQAIVDAGVCAYCLTSNVLPPVDIDIDREVGIALAGHVDTLESTPL